MLRLIGLCLFGLLAAPAWGAPPLPDASPLHPSAHFVPLGPQDARGALVWLHGAYDSNAMPSPPEPGWVSRMARRSLDIWRFDRKRGQDALLPGGEALARGLRALRAGGYRRIIVAGYSRGGWIALLAMTYPGAADGIVAFSPAAHGTSPERQRQAFAEWQSLWHAARPGPRVVLVQLAGDPYDPEPARRLGVANQAAGRVRIPLQSVFLPEIPTGHGGTYEPEFDARFGTEIADFVDPPMTR
ncbi:MAG: alpha/beta hydrolase family protein [Acetobacteraceae bacterium]